MVQKSNMVAACDCCWGDIVDGDYFMIYEKYKTIFVPVCLSCAAKYSFDGTVKKAAKELFHND